MSFEKHALALPRRLRAPISAHVQNGTVELLNCNTQEVIEFLPMNDLEISAEPEEPSENQVVPQGVYDGSHFETMQRIQDSVASLARETSRRISAALRYTQTSSSKH